MSTDLIFSQPTPQNPPTEIPSDKIGPSGLDRSSKIQTSHQSPEGDDDNFLTTLKQVSQDQSPANRHQHVGEARSPKTTASVGGGEIDEASDHETSPGDIPLNTEQAAQPDQMLSEGKISEFIKLLENMGFHAAIGASDLQNMANANLGDSNQMVAVKSLITQLQQNQFGPTADLKAGLERIQQLLAIVPMPIDGNPGQGISSGQVTDLAQMNQWLKGLSSGLQDQNGNTALLTGAGASGVMPSGAIAAGAEGSAEAAVKSLAMNSDRSGTATFQSTQNSDVLSQSENRSGADLKLTTESQPLVSGSDHDSKAAPAVESPDTDASKIKAPNPKAAPAVESPGADASKIKEPNPKAAPAVESPDADASKIKEPMGFERDPRTTNRAEVSRRMATTPDMDQQASTANMRDNLSIKSSASSAPGPAVVKMTENQIQSTSGEEPLSKVFQEAQPVKEGAVKVASGASEETVSKVIKTEAGTNDNGLLNSTGHNTEKAAESASLPKETEASQSSLRNQTVDQIVRKAAIHLRNGQHEARIDLKPDFLGHIRMQVISENHQVTVRIMAEHGFVKDMIESNVHQLKADLQQQGIEVDKLEVSVSRDSEDSGNSREKLAQSRAKQGNADRQNQDRPTEEEQRKDTRQPPGTADGARTVDYFA